jgi:hypothetical protein
MNQCVQRIFHRQGNTIQSYKIAHPLKNKENLWFATTEIILRKFQDTEKQCAPANLYMESETVKLQETE